MVTISLLPSHEQLSIPLEKTDLEKHFAMKQLACDC